MTSGVDAWGTWCRVCRTVRLRSTSVICTGAPGTKGHPSALVLVIP